MRHTVVIWAWKPYIRHSSVTPVALRGGFFFFFSSKERKQQKNKHGYVTLRLADEKTTLSVKIALLAKSDSRMLNYQPVYYCAVGHCRLALFTICNSFRSQQIFSYFHQPPRIEPIDSAARTLQ